jgi:hypothetical protein
LRFFLLFLKVCVFDLTLDASRAEVGQEQTVVDRLFRTLSSLMDATLQNVTKFPSDAADALSFFKKEALKKFPAAQVFPLSERFMLNAIVSVVSSPYPAIVERVPSTNAHRSLVALAKVLQTTASQMEHSPSILELQAFVFAQNNLDRAVSFLKRLCSSSFPASPRSGGAPGFDHVAHPAEMTPADWVTLERFAAAVQVFAKPITREALTAELTSSGGSSLRALCASIMKKEDVLSFIPCIFRLFRSLGLEEVLITWAINEHVSSVSEADPIFFGLHGKKTIPLMIVDFFVDREGTSCVRLSEVFSCVIATTFF